jgi:hypothetical protein
MKEGEGDKLQLRDTIIGMDGKVKADTMAKGKSKMYEIKLKKLSAKAGRKPCNSCLSIANGGCLFPATWLLGKKA